MQERFENREDDDTGDSIDRFPIEMSDGMVCVYFEVGEAEVGEADVAVTVPSFMSKWNVMNPSCQDLPRKSLVQEKFYLP